VEAANVIPAAIVIPATPVIPILLRKERNLRMVGATTPQILRRCGWLSMTISSFAFV